jgi:hypothetical protein
MGWQARATSRRSFASPTGIRLRPRTPERVTSRKVVPETTFAERCRVSPPGVFSASFPLALLPVSCTFTGKSGSPAVAMDAIVGHVPKEVFRDMGNGTTCSLCATPPLAKVAPSPVRLPPRGPPAAPSGPRLTRWVLRPPLEPKPAHGHVFGRGPVAHPRGDFPRQPGPRSPGSTARLAAPRRA